MTNNELVLPRIKKTEWGGWQCFGLGSGGFGLTPRGAWLDWHCDLHLFDGTRERYAAAMEKASRK